jgi:hypothetical protein
MMIEVVDVIEDNKTHCVQKSSIDCSFNDNHTLYMKRSPLKRKTPLKSGSGSLARTPLKRVSKKRRSQMADYKGIREDYLKKNPLCHCCQKKPSTDIHHKAGRWQERLNDVAFFCALCRQCHNYIHANPEWGYANLWLVRR